MPVQVCCPNPACGRSARVPDDFLGRMVRCPVCREKFRVSRDGAVAASVAGGTAEVSGVATMGVGAGPSSVPDLPPRVGRFLVRARLGAGAFGTVYRAFDPQLEREVALKVPRPGTLDNPRAVGRFLREAKAAASLRHPHIVPIYDAGQDDDLYYIASAFVDGRTLAQAIDEESIAFRQAAQIVHDLAEALAYAHRQGIVHRDVKPANIMLDSKGDVHLMDFGLAHRQDLMQKLTHDGAVLGTPAYMAPEQAKGQTGEPLPASDQYSLGVVLYELLCGQTPFSGPPQILLFNVIHTEPPAPRKIKAHVPRDLETICLKAMAKRPEDRYASCQELADDLRRWQEGEPVRARRQRPVERLAKWCRRHPLTALSMSVALFCLVAVAIVASLAATRLALLRERESDARQRAEKAQAEAEVQRQEALAKARAEAQARQEVEDAHKRIDDAQKAAEEQRKRQDEAREDAKKAQQVAEEAEKQRDSARKGQVEEKEQAERARAREAIQRYYRIIAQANREIEAKNLVRAENNLDECDPQFRQWEWHYLKARCKGNVPLVLGAHGSTLAGIAFRPDSRELASVSLDATVRLWNLETGKPILSFSLRPRKDGALSVAFCAEGDRLITVTAQGGVRLRNLVNGTEISQLHPSFPTVKLPFARAAFSANAEKVALCFKYTYYYGYYVLNAKDGKKVKMYSREHNFEPGAAMALNHDGTCLASGHASSENISLFNTASGQEIGRLDSPVGPSVRCLAFSADGRQLASSRDETVRIWKVHLQPSELRPSLIPELMKQPVIGEEHVRLNGHTKHVSSLAFSPDGQRVFAGAADGTIKIWCAATGQEILTLSGQHGEILNLAISADGKYLAAASADKSIKLWRTTSRSPQGNVTEKDSDKDQNDRRGNKTSAPYRVGHQLKAHTGSVGDLQFSEDGTQLASTGSDARIALWNAETGECLDRQATPFAGVPSGVVVDNSQLVVVFPDGNIECFENRQLKETRGAGSAGIRSALSSDGRLRAYVWKEGCLSISPTCGDKENVEFDVKRSASKNALALSKHFMGLTSIALSPNKKYFISADDSATIWLWDVYAIPGRSNAPYMSRPTMIIKPRTVLKGHEGQITCVTFDKNGDRLASASADRTVRIWDLKTCKCIQTLRGHSGEVTWVSFSNDTKLLASSSTDHTIRIWDAATGEARGVLGNHAKPVRRVRFSPRGECLVSGDDEGIIIIWYPKG